MLRYENKKTGSLLNFPDEQTISGIDDVAYLIKIMIWNDERVMKNNITKLVTVLKNFQTVKSAQCVGRELGGK